jgi:hypothetical protein
MGNRRFWTEEEINFLKKFYPTKGSKFVANKLGRTPDSVKRKSTRIGLKVVVVLSHRAYSPQEIIFIKKNYPLKGCHYVSKMLGRNVTSIYKKARNLGLERNINLKWSDEEDEYLKKWYKKKRPSEIARRLKRSTSAVVVRARKLGLLKFFMRRWTNDEEHYLIKNFRKMTYKQIGKHLNRTQSSVEGKKHSMKMIKVIERSWTPQEKRFLTRFYGKKPIAEIAKRLNRTHGSIVGRAKIQKLKKKGPPDYTEKEKNFIMKNYLNMTNRQIAGKLSKKISRVKRTVSGISRMGMKLGLTGKLPKQRVFMKIRTDLYTDAEKEFIRKNYLKMTNIQIAKKLNRTTYGIIEIAKRLRLRGAPGKRRLWKRGNPSTFYSEAEKNFIRKNYLKMTNEQLARELKRPVNSAANMIRRLGLAGHLKRREYMKRIRRKAVKK